MNITLLRNLEHATTNKSIYADSYVDIVVDIAPPEGEAIIAAIRF